MFSYTKVLPLALLLSIPVIAMDKQLTPATAPAAALDSTLLCSEHLTDSVDSLKNIRQQIDALKEQEKVAVANKNTFAEKLEAKYRAKCDEICGLDALKLEAERKINEAEKQKNSALEALEAEYAKSKEALETQLHEAEIKFGKTKSTKEKEHDAIIASYAKLKLQRETEITAATANRDRLHEQLTQARSGEVTPKTGLLGLGFMGL